jgi:hypothetical protein
VRAAGKETKTRITEVGAKKTAASVNETSRKRNQAQDYGSGSKNVGYSYYIVVVVRYLSARKD